MKKPLMRILSLGAGVQSSTMALMADQGAFGEKPDAAIFADTGWEPTPVIDHLNYLKSKLSFPVHICKAGNLHDDILRATDNGKFVSVPFFTLNEKGKKGMGRRQCTREYKITPIAAKIRELLGMKKYARFPKGEHVETWVGISTDEVFRVKESRFWWQKNRWPLIEKKMSREDCIKWMLDNKFPKPPRSACTYCPYHSNEEWLNIKKDKEEWDAVVKLDKQLRTGLYNCQPEKYNYYLHRSGQPLDEVDFSNEKNSKQLDMEFGFENACEGMCGV